MIADDIRAYIRRFLIVTPEQEVACTLWVMHTWAFEAAVATPYLAAISATKQSGKTRLLEVLECLVRVPLLASGMSEASLFRAIAHELPTMLLDEVDALFGSAVERTEPIRGVLNSGNREGGQVLRSVPPNWSTRAFSTFCPKVLAGIDNGRWPDTLLDRSIVLRMKRRNRDEPVERFRQRRASDMAEPLRTMCEEWAEAAHDELLEADPAMPETLSDRACDAWEPLLAIADALGGTWPQEARQAAVVLYQAQQGLEDSAALTVLADVRTIFDRLEVDRLPSQNLVKELKDIEDAPWARWEKTGLTPNDLARLLRPFEISPAVHRFSNTSERGSTARGYLRTDFQDAWQRYLEVDHDASTV